MAAERIPGIPHIANYLALLHHIALLDGKSAHVGIQGSVAIPVVQNDIVAIAENAVVVGGRYHRAAC